MAFSTKITFVPRDNGEKVICFDGVDYGLDPTDRDFPDWHQKDFMDYKNLHFRIVGDYYVDFAAVLNFEEFLQFHALHYKEENWDTSVSKFLHNKGKQKVFSWVIVEIYEWESGLDF